MMLYAKQNLGTKRTDKSFDPLYNRVNSFFAFAAVLTMQSLALMRTLLLVEGRWPPQHDQIPRTLELFISLIDWGALTPSLALTVTATTIYAAGFGLRLWAIGILGRLFTFEIGIRDNHKIIEEGPYQVIRHPSYTGYLLMLVGLGLALGSLSLFMPLFLGTCIFFVLRIRSEEKMLVAYFGEKYRQYQRRTKRLVPFVF